LIVVVAAKYGSMKSLEGKQARILAVIKQRGVPGRRVFTAFANPGHAPASGIGGGVYAQRFEGDSNASIVADGGPRAAGALGICPRQSNASIGVPLISVPRVPVLCSRI
jgi:hypothetical protein